MRPSDRALCLHALPSDHRPLLCCGCCALLCAAAAGFSAQLHPTAAAAMRRILRRAATVALIAIGAGCANIAAAATPAAAASASGRAPIPPQGCPTPSVATTANTPGIPARQEVSIDAVTVLLPAHVDTPLRTYVVYHPVQAHGGCFTWRTSNPALVVVQPIAATACTERVAQRNALTGQAEWVTLEGHTSVYVSAAASLLQAVQPDEGGGTGPTAPGAPHTSNKSFQRRLQAWISAHDITKLDRFAEWSAHAAVLLRACCFLNSLVLLFLSLTLSGITW